LGSGMFLFLNVVFRVVACECRISLPCLCVRVSGLSCVSVPLGVASLFHVVSLTLLSNAVSLFRVVSLTLLFNVVSLYRVPCFGRRISLSRCLSFTLSLFRCFRISYLSFVSSLFLCFLMSCFAIMSLPSNAVSLVHVVSLSHRLSFVAF